jgi:hypothetical protein
VARRDRSSTDSSLRSLAVVPMALSVGVVR